MSTERLLARGELVGGRFTIERPFAAGGMGRIYRAVDALGGAHVALKVMTSDDGDNDLPRFAREASVLAELGHPAIVRYVAHGSTGATSDVYGEQQNIRSAHLFGGQLFASTQLGAAPSETVSRVFAIGLGAPKSSTIATTALPGVSVSNPNTFVLLDMDLGVEGYDTLYVSDTNNAVGVRKYLSNGAVWVERASLGVPLDTACLNVIARAQTPPLVLCAASNGVVYRWRDTPLADGGSPERSIVVAAPANTVFRGLAFER